MSFTTLYITMMFTHKMAEASKVGVRTRPILVRRLRHANTCHVSTRPRLLPTEPPGSVPRAAVSQ